MQIVSTLSDYTNLLAVIGGLITVLGYEMYEGEEDYLAGYCRLY